MVCLIWGWAAPSAATTNVISVNFDRTIKACADRLRAVIPPPLSPAERDQIFQRIYDQVDQTPEASLSMIEDVFWLREWISHEPYLRLRFEYGASVNDYVIWVDGPNPLVTYVIRSPDLKLRLREKIAQRSGGRFMDLRPAEEFRRGPPRLMDALVL